MLVDGITAEAGINLWDHHAFEFCGLITALPAACLPTNGLPRPRRLIEAHGLVDPTLVVWQLATNRDSWTDDYVRSVSCWIVYSSDQRSLIVLGREWVPDEGSSCR